MTLRGKNIKKGRHYNEKIFKKKKILRGGVLKLEKRRH